MINELSNSETAQVLEDDKAFIMADWLEHVRAEISTAKSKSDSQIYNHLSLFINTLITGLRTNQAQDTVNENQVISKEHGEQRSHLAGYTLEQIIHEYHLLRETIFEYLVVERDVNLTEKDRKIINSFIDQSIQSATAEFVRKANEEQKFIQSELEETVKARDKFLSIASHELKTPLTTLFLQAQLRRRQYNKGNMALFEGDKIRDMIEADLKQLSGLNKLIEDMLDIGRIRTGRLQLNKEQINLAEVALAAFEKFKPQIEEKGGAFDFKIEDEFFVEADPYRMDQVISNLLTNALKYGQGKPLAAKVFCDKEHKKGFIVIRDSGMGIDEADKERIFQIFERAISANEVSGLGLGLAIVKEIVHAHGGEILVDSEVGVGSTFTVSLPLVPVH